MVDILEKLPAGIKADGDSTKASKTPTGKKATQAKSYSE
jgi:hypothetical protein